MSVTVQVSYYPDKAVGDGGALLDLGATIKVVGVCDTTQKELASAAEVFLSIGWMALGGEAKVSTRQYASTTYISVRFCKYSAGLCSGGDLTLFRRKVDAIANQLKSIFATE